MIDLLGSIADAMTNQPTEGAIKTRPDLDRYERVFAATNPDLIIETGTLRGESARWFAQTAKCDVVTIDIHPEVGFDTWVNWGFQVTPFAGNSVSPKILREVRAIAAKHERVMVVLDSDHSKDHVAKEMRLYGPLVSEGCYMVVEDGLAKWMPWFLYNGNPFDAIEEYLVEEDGWVLDSELEDLFPTTQCPHGWLRRGGEAPVRPELIATDLDGTWNCSWCEGAKPALVISGRTWAEYDERARAAAMTMPIYIRGTGNYGDREDAAQFKVKMITQLGVTTYYEDDPLQAERIRYACPGVKVVSP